MAIHVRGSFADLLDVRFREVADEQAHALHDDYIPHLWAVTPPTKPFRPDERYSEISDLARAGQFTGSIDYAQFYQGYDTTATYVEFGQGIQIERLLVEYDQFHEIEDRSKSLVRSMYRARQNAALRHLRNAFSVDTYFHNRSEGVAICSNSHTTTTGVSTTAGFDNYVTTALSAANLSSMQILAADLRTMAGEPEEVVIDGLICPIDLYEVAWEIINSMGKVDGAQNNRNVHYGAFSLILLRNKVDFSDTNNWFGVDMEKMKRACLWFDQVWTGQPEMGMAEEFDTFVAKYRAYDRFTNTIRDWRPFIGAEVS